MVAIHRITWILDTTKRSDVYPLMAYQIPMIIIVDIVSMMIIGESSDRIGSRQSIPKPTCHQPSTALVLCERVRRGKEAVHSGRALRRDPSALCGGVGYRLSVRLRSADDAVGLLCFSLPVPADPYSTTVRCWSPPRTAVLGCVVAPVWGLKPWRAAPSL